MPFVEDYKLSRVIAAQANGTETLNSSVVDMQGFDSVAFLVAAGSITGGIENDNMVATVQQGDQSDGSDATSTSATLALTGADDNKTMVVDCVAVKQRYVRLQLFRSGVLEGVWAIQYNGADKPVTQGSTIEIASFIVT